MSNMMPPAGLMSMLDGQAPRPEPEQPESTVEILRQMIELAKQYIEVEEDAEDKFTMGDILRKLLQYEADEQKERDQAVGASPAVKFLRRQSA